MKTHKAVASLISAAQNELRCVYSRNEAEQTALRRRAQSGELLKVYDGIPSLYANTAYWDGLTLLRKSILSGFLAAWWQ